MFARPEAANCKIGVAVTAGEKAQIERAAFARGLSVAAYIRQCLGWLDNSQLAQLPTNGNLNLTLARTKAGGTHDHTTVSDRLALPDDHYVGLLEVND